MASIHQDEVISARQLAREYADQLGRIEEGEIDKLVVMRKGKMEAVVLRYEDYEKLMDERSG